MTGWAALLSGRNGLRSLALAGGVALHAINVYLTTTILPSVVASIGGLEYYAWNTTLFVTASILGSSLSASLLRRVGPRAAYAVASTCFAIGSVLCAVAPTMAQLLVGRVIQGLGGGFLMALSYAMIQVVFAEALWPRAMALVSGMWGVATLVGPAVGGFFAEHGSWRLAFWCLLPTTALFAVLARLVLPPHRQVDEHSKVPLAQIVLLIATVLAISAGSVASGLIWQVAGVVGAAIASVALREVELNARTPLLPRGALHISKPLANLYITLSLLAMVVTSGEIFIALFLQVLHARTPLIAGYLAALMAAGWTVGSLASAGASPRRVTRIIVMAPALVFGGTVALAFLVPSTVGTTTSRLLAIGAGLVVVGFGVGVSWPHLLTRVLHAVGDRERDLASASLTTIQVFVTALGASVAGLIVNLAGLTNPGGVVGTANAARWLFAVFALAPAVAVVTAIRSERPVGPLANGTEETAPLPSSG